MKLVRLALFAPALLGCGGASVPRSSGAPATDPRPVVVDEELEPAIPAGFGTLRQDDIALRLQLTGVLVKAIPLDEDVIRVLSPDSYRALRELRGSQAGRIDVVAARHGLRERNVWYVSFFGLQDGAHFSPRELVITSLGRDFRPLEVVPLSSGFGTQRLDVREVQSALYVFEDGLDAEQPLTLRVETEQTAAWQSVLRLIERERALIRSRAGQPPATP